MKNEYLKTLWLLRFQKIYRAEETAISSYQGILDCCLETMDEDDEVIQLLRRIIREERMHAKLAEELIRLGCRNHPECENLAV